MVDGFLAWANKAWPLADLESGLGMRAWVTPNPANSRLCTGVLVRGELLVDEPRLYRHSALWHIPPTDLTLRLVDEPDRPWTVVSVHHAYHSPRQCTSPNLETDSMPPLATTGPTRVARSGSTGCTSLLGSPSR